MADLDVIDPTFVADLLESQTAVWRVAQWLSGRGHHVTVRTAAAIRPSARERDGYGDSGDLELIQRVEVKQRRNLTFTSAADYPFPTVFVDSVAKWDRAMPKPYAYVIVNPEMTALAIVKGTTAPQWSRVERWDKGRLCAFYVCPISLVQFEVL